DPTLGLTLKEIVQTAGDTVDLSEANVVVAAGRGVRDEAGKALIDELASITGAAIGASRAVVETGLFPATAQIGQTGKVVSPDLYFAVGISGAVQHTAGMANSRVIVAINKDPDAPIFDVATYGLVGDCFAILPLLNAALKNALASN
ncbi:MAG: electron transfer flavoprotein subunit alpha/FixB family protein, partial [Bacteroidota bacterium]|nr:electron transfer flavoprotein subunit alpha/FixB family protein [Bacteroidota bacterium]